jgi:hypothetical protein
MILASFMRANLIEAIAIRVADAGLNVIGAATAGDYDARVRADLRLATRHPWARSLVVVGNGGGDFWRAFERRGGPEIVSDPNPLDRFTRTVIAPAVAEALRETAVRGLLVYPFEFATEPISFMDAAVAAGLGAPSLLGLLVHPRFGPWMALRAAVLVDATVAAPRPAAGFDPGPSCVARPCLAACPGAAVDVARGWDFARCIDHRRATGDCAERCHARVACVYGRDARYPDAAVSYHHGRAWKAMATFQAARGARPAASSDDP